MLAGLPQITFLKVWHFRARRKSFPERFGISALGESRFPNGLVFPRMAKVVSRKVWHFRGWRKSFPKGFGVSAFSESYFPNSLGLVVAKIWNKNLSGFWIYNYQGTSSGSSSAIFGGSSYALSQTSQGDPTIIASQIPVGAWYEAIADQTIADAIMDRIIHVGQLKFN